MAINDISLTSGMRTNLLSLQDTTSLLNRTQERLSTGKKVNTAIDNPVSFFAAQSLNSRASKIDSLKDAMGQAIQTIKAADNGIKAITSMIEQAKGIAQQALGADATEAAALEEQFDSLLDQIDALSADSIYKGKNLLGGDDLSVKFEGNGTTTTLDVAGFEATAAGDLKLTAVTGVWQDGTDVATTAVQTSLDALDDALDTLSSQSSTLSSNLSIITVRQDFSTNMVNTLSEGSDKLTLADTNQEGANMLMLQTRQSLATTALSLSAQAAQSVLKLFG